MKNGRRFRAAVKYRYGDFYILTLENGAELRLNKTQVRKMEPLRGFPIVTKKK